MAKFIKSFFQTEKRSHSYEGSDEERSDVPPPMEGRRKLSVSRSGRMRQAQKKRLSLSMDIYGDDTLQTPDKPKTMEYHVSSMSTSVKVPNPNYGRPSLDSRTSSGSDRSATSANDPESAKHDPKQKKVRNNSINTELKKKTPEEEIDIAFEVIDKTIAS